MRIGKRIAAGTAALCLALGGRYFTSAQKERALPTKASAEAELSWPADAPISRKQTKELLGSLGYVR